MSFPRYEKYKDSGVEWLGEVPEHWDVLKISNISTKITNGYVGPTRDILIDSGVKYLQSLHIKANRINFDGQYFVSEHWSRLHTKSILELGDVLVVQTGDIGQVAVVTEEYSGCNCHALIIISPDKKLIYGEWLSLVLNSDYGFHSLSSIQTGALHPHLNCGNVKDLMTTVPPKEEQLLINCFLDRETAKIDALIAEQQKLIELLREKRQAVISHAVTKGLNPDAKMKDSGIEWLGDVPEHWSVKKSIYILDKLQDGTHFSPASDVCGDYLYITAKNIKEWGIDLSDVSYISKDDHDEIYKRCPVCKGDVLYIKDGATAGIATINTIDTPFSLLSSVAMLRPNPDCFDSRYLAYHLNSRSFKTFILNSLVGGAMPRFTIEIIKKFKFVTPSISEQQAIAAFLDKETSKLDTLISEAKKAITLLQERRTALISAAVTGKIDVRGFVPDSESGVAA